MLTTEREYEGHTFLGFRPLTNPANPCLSDARAYREKRGISWVQILIAFAGSAHIYRETNVPADQIAHARAVLTRLARVVTS